MIISCEKCTKKFNITDNLIPEEGRLLQCGSCNHKWFYKISTKVTSQNKNTTDLINQESTNDENKEKTEKIDKSSISIKKKETQKIEKKTINNNKKKISKGPNLIKKITIFIISIIALLILADTFKYELENYIPNINNILNNLYETLKDIFLFAKDLIK